MPVTSTPSDALRAFNAAESLAIKDNRLTPDEQNALTTQFKNLSKTERDQVLADLGVLSRTGYDSTGRYKVGAAVAPLIEALRTAEAQIDARGGGSGSSAAATVSKEKLQMNTVAASMAPKHSP